MDDSALRSRLHFALALVDEVSPRIMRAYSPAGVRFDTKADGSPVTIADRDAEAHLRQRVERAFPTDAFLGEEFGERPGNSGFRWVVDPIDGTKAFVAGVPLFGTLIGIERNGRCVAGVMNLPAVGELLFAEVTEGCWHRHGDGEARRARVSPVSRLADATVTMTEPACLTAHGCAEGFDKLAKGCKQLKGWGDCFGYALVATGRAEVAMDRAIAPWDVAALVPIITEAGGSISDWNGATPTAAAPIKNCVATNGKVTAEVLATLRGA